MENFDWKPNMLKCWSKPFGGIPTILMKQIFWHTIQMVSNVPYGNDLQPTKVFCHKVPFPKKLPVKKHVITDKSCWTYNGRMNYCQFIVAKDPRYGGLIPSWPKTVETQTGPLLNCFKWFGFGIVRWTLNLRVNTHPLNSMM